MAKRDSVGFYYNIFITWICLLLNYCYLFYLIIAICKYVKLKTLNNNNNNISNDDAMVR